MVSRLFCTCISAGFAAVVTCSAGQVHAQEPTPVPAQEPSTTPAQGSPAAEPATTSPNTPPATTQQEPTPPVPADPAPVEPAPAPKAKPKGVKYTIPWLMRPVIMPAAVLRADFTSAWYENAAGDAGRTIITPFTVIYKIPGTGGPAQGLGVCARLTLAHDSPPGAKAGTVIANPFLCVAYAMAVTPEFRLNFFGGATVPVGGGGGDSPGAAAANARAKGGLARSAMENPIYGVNDFTPAIGVGAAYLASGLVLQWDIGFTHSIRVRGEKAQPEASKTNFTTGIHVGYFLTDNLSLGAELHYQHWINPPFAAEKDSALLDVLSFAVGPRAHIPLGFAWLRPGISYQRGLDKPMAASTPNYHVLQIDIPMTF